MWRLRPHSLLVHRELSLSKWELSISIVRSVYRRVWWALVHPVRRLAFADLSADGATVCPLCLDAIRESQFRDTKESQTLVLLQGVSR